MPGDYIPSPREFVRDHVAQYESSGGKEGWIRPETGHRMILVTHTGNKTGATRKVPLMRVKDGENYVLVGSMGGQPRHPVWVHNLRANPEVEIRDGEELCAMKVREVDTEPERTRLWEVSVGAFAPYAEYQTRTTRRLPLFLAEPDTVGAQARA